MRTFSLAVLLVTSISAAQNRSSTAAENSLSDALLGRWAGVLEYRDYSEPASSTKRVQLPTWLSIAPAPEGLSLDYTYDDGPTKTETSHNSLVLNFDAKTYKTVSTDNALESYTITNLDQLKDGRGTLTLKGPAWTTKRPPRYAPRGPYDAIRSPGLKRSVPPTPKVLSSSATATPSQAQCRRIPRTKRAENSTTL